MRGGRGPGAGGRGRGRRRHPVDRNSPTGGHLSRCRWTHARECNLQPDRRSPLRSGRAPAHGDQRPARRAGGAPSREPDAQPAPLSASRSRRSSSAPGLLHRRPTRRPAFSLAGARRGRGRARQLDRHRPAAVAVAPPGGAGLLLLAGQRLPARSGGRLVRGPWLFLGHLAPACSVNGVDGVEPVGPLGIGGAERRRGRPASPRLRRPGPAGPGRWRPSPASPSAASRRRGPRSGGCARATRRRSAARSSRVALSSLRRRSAMMCRSRSLSSAWRSRQQPRADSSADSVTRSSWLGSLVDRSRSARGRRPRTSGR